MIVTFRDARGSFRRSNLFYVIPVVHDPESGYCPALPEGLSFRLIACPSTPGYPYALYECSDLETPQRDDEDLPPGVLSLPPDLAYALHAASRYEPAMALMQMRQEQRLSQRRRGTGLTEPVPAPPVEEFLQTIKGDLVAELDAQHRRPFLLARARRDIGYLTKDAWYWILGYNSRYNTVSWIHEYDEIECCPANEFLISHEELVERFGHAPAGESWPWPLSGRT